MARLPILVRRNKVFELVLDGKTHDEIARLLGVSDDTIARDLKVISDQVQALVAERSGEILAAAIATLGQVIIDARREFDADRKRERDWFAGKLDYPTLETTEQAGGEAKITTTKTGTARPAWRSQRYQWLKIILDATRDLVELTGLKEIVIRHKGTVQLELTEAGEKEAAEKLSSWRATMLEQLKSSSAPSALTPPTSPTNTGSSTMPKD